MKKNITQERKMFEMSFERPKNFFKLSSDEQWQIDKKLGILDWNFFDFDWIDGLIIAGRS